MTVSSNCSPNAPVFSHFLQIWFKLECVHYSGGIAPSNIWPLDQVCSLPSSTPYCHLKFLHWDLTMTATNNDDRSEICPTVLWIWRSLKSMLMHVYVCTVYRAVLWRQQFSTTIQLFMLCQSPPICWPTLACRWQIHWLLSMQTFGRGQNMNCLINASRSQHQWWWWWLV